MFFLGNLGKHNSAGQTALKNLFELKELPEDPGDQGVLTYIKKLSTYVSDTVATLLGFARDAEVSALVLGK